ncbi:MAG TPA: hypothetical protein VF623_05580 [Segetibacter sp.]|jgi:hypothetical protein
MKKLIVAASIFSFFACGGNTANNEVESKSNADSVGLTNPITIDTLKHPTGMDNSNVISTDTAAMNVQNSVNKAKAAQKKH